MQNIRPKNMGIGMSNLPNTRVGVQADANAFGAARARQTQELANAGLRASLAVTDEAQRRMVKEDNAHLDQALVESHAMIAEKRKAIYDQYKLGEAHKVPQEINSMMQKVQHDMDRKLLNNHQRERYAHAFQSMLAQENENAINYHNQQSDAYFVKSSTDAIDAMTGVAAGKITTASGFTDAINGPYLSMILAKTDELTEGQSPESRQLARDKMSRSYHEKMLTTAGQLSPDMALEYLKDKRVQGSFNEAEYKGLKAKWQQHVTEATESAQAKKHYLAAMQDEAAGMTENEARQQYYSDPSLTDEQAKSKLDAFKSTRSASNAETIAMAADRKKQLEDAYAETGFNIAALPESLKPTKREQEELVKWGNTFRANGGKNPPPDINYLFKLDAMSQSELQEYLLNPANSETFYNGVGGAGSTFAKEYIEKARGNQAGKRPLTDTNAGWAAAKFAEDEDLVLGSERDGKLIKDFSSRFETLAKDEARRQGLKNENDLSPDDRNKVYQKMRALGKYTSSPIFNAVTFGLFGNEERTYYDMLADEEADFDNFSPYSESSPPPAPDVTMNDDNYWAYGHSVASVTNAPEPKPPAKKTADELPEAVRHVIGHKDVETTPIYDSSGDIHYVKVVDKSASGKRTIYLNTDGRTVSEEEALAGQ